PDPLMPRRRDGVRARELVAVGAELAVAEPRIAVRRERGACDEGAGRRLARLQHLDAALRERVGEHPPRSGGESHYAFSAPLAIPLTNCRWNATKMQITGTTAIT